MSDLKLLLLRDCLTVYELAQLMSRDGGRVSDAESLITEAIEANKLPAAKLERWVITDYWNGDYFGNINQMTTTMQREDIDGWLHSKGLPTLLLVSRQQESPGSEAQAVSVAESPKPAQTWQDHARIIADECYARDTTNECRDGVGGYAKRAMAEMRERGIKGPRGFIENYLTIQREALGGNKWWSGKR